MNYRFHQHQEAQPVYTDPSADSQPYVTWLILALNLFAWIAVTVTKGSQDDTLLRFGAMSGPYIADGQYWRLFTAMFLHAGAIHLLVNSVGLFLFGRTVEKIYGHQRFALVYVLSGLGGSVLSYMLNSPYAIGVGASGAIIGVVGTLGAFFIVKREVLGDMARQNLKWIMVMVAINLFLAFGVSRIDNWAHVGGFLIGFVVGLAFVPNYQVLRDPVRSTITLFDRNPLQHRWWVVPVVLAILALGVMIGTATLPENTLTLLKSSRQHIEERHYEDALIDANEALRMNPFQGEAYFIRALVHFELGNQDMAINDLTNALQFGLDGKSNQLAKKLLVDLSSR